MVKVFLVRDKELKKKMSNSCADISGDDNTFLAIRISLQSMFCLPLTI